MRFEAASAPSRGRTWSTLLVAGLTLLALGCAGSSRRPATPPTDAEFGEASWYGIEERGRPTANGEAMDPGGMTAAHRTLPFGTVVAVTDLDTGRVVEVRINDRGPFIAGRIIDLSHEAARRLGIERRGVARVMLTIAKPAPESSFTVQVAAFRGRAAAERLSSDLRDKGYSGVQVIRAGRIHRVRVGPFGDRREAEGIARDLRRRGYDALVVQVRL